MSLSLSDLRDLLGIDMGQEERLGDSLSGSVDVDLDSVESVREVRENV